MKGRTNLPWQVAATGYRRALEYLIRDFCIKTKVAGEKEIKSKILSACITDYIADPKLKECALRANWLGNDENLYIRRWEDKDIVEIKALIQLSKNWILTYMQAENYIKEANLNR